MNLSHYIIASALVIGVVSSVTAEEAPFEKIDSATSPTEKIHRVVVGRPVDRADALNLKKRLEDAGYNSVFASYDPLFGRVAVGQFDNVPDAEELKDDLAANGFEVVQLVSESNSQLHLHSKHLFDFSSDGMEGTSTALSGKSNRLRLASLPSLASIDAPALEPLLAKEQLPAPANLESRTDFTAVADEMKRIFTDRPNTDPVKGYALYYYALAQERTVDKDDATAALDLFKKLALGEIAAPAGYRVKALLQYVDMVHYTEEKHIDAYRIYKLILASDWLTGAARAEVQAELSGCVHEMMEHHKQGTPSDVRHELKEIYAVIPEEFRKPRATVELIYSMTWFWERDSGGLDRAAAHSRLLQEKYPDVPAVVAQAVWNEAIALERNGDVQAARDAAEKAVQIYIDPADAFRSRLKSWNMEKRITKLIARLEAQLKDDAAAKRWTEYSDKLQDSTPTLQMRVPGMK